MFTSAFWRDLAERAVRAAAISALGVTGSDGLGLLSTGLGGALTTVGLATFVSILISLAAGSGVVGDKGSASLLGAPGGHAGTSDTNGGHL